MWRGYGANGNGVALVFNTRFVTTQEGSPLLIAKVRYGSRQERADWLMEFFTKCLTILKTRGTNTNPQHIWHTAMNMFRLTLYQSLSSKHPGFAEEDEWRIVYLSDLDRHNLFKDRRHYYIRGNTIEPKLNFDRNEAMKPGGGCQNSGRACAVGREWPNPYGGLARRCGYSRTDERWFGRQPI